MTRKIINRVLTVAGGLTLISGLFMLFHYESHLTQTLHELAALVTSFFMIMHIKTNWAALKNALKPRVFTQATLGIFFVCTAIMLVFGNFDHKELEVRERIKTEFGIELPHGRLK